MKWTKCQVDAENSKKVKKADRYMVGYAEEDNVSPCLEIRETGLAGGAGWVGSGTQLRASGVGGVGNPARWFTAER